MEPGATCGWLLEDKTVCAKAAEFEVTISGRIGSGKLPVCPEHKATFNQKAAALRNKTATSKR